MSRCFPFIHPGYEKKVITDDPSLLKKDKYREKVQKKEKKGSKEKREKKRTDEKRREKKDNREKRRDKKEETYLNKGKYKGDALFPDEKTGLELPDVHLQKSHEKSREWVNDGNVLLAEKRVSGTSLSNNGAPVSRNNQLATQTKIVKTPKSLLGSDRRNSNEDRNFVNQLPNKNILSDRPIDGVVKITGRGATPAVDGGVKTNDKPVVQKMDILGVGEESVLSQNAVRPVKLPSKSQGILTDEREKKFEQKLDAGAKVREEGNYKKGDKRKEETREKTIDKDEDREMTIGEKGKGTREVKKNVQMPVRKDGGENHILTPNSNAENKRNLSAILNDGLQSIPRPSSLDDVNATLLGKRKDIGINGIYDEHTTGLNKLARMTASTHPLTVMKSCQNSASLAARPPMNIQAERTFAPDETQRPPINNITVGGKEPKMNNIKKQSSQKTSKRERKCGTLAKPPHPDTKYLSHVLAVPKLDECPELDDQEWLCSFNSSQTRKCLSGTSGVEEEPKVWANALWLEPVDMFALPYVIPH